MPRRIRGDQVPGIRPATTLAVYVARAGADRRTGFYSPAFRVWVDARAGR